MRKEIKGPAWIARMRRHRHNGYSGHAAMMEMQLRAILESDSTSADTKSIARTMLYHVPELKSSLKKRIDP